MANEQEYILIGKVLSGEATEAELRWLREWLAASEANKAEFSLMQKAWQASEAALQAGAFPKPDTQAAWAKVRARTVGANKMGGNDPKVVPMQPAPTTAYRAWWQAAAAVVLLGIVGWLAVGWWQARQLAPLDYVAQSQTDTLYLEDGSRVILDSGSVLQYPREFGGVASREVVLQGRGFFDVAHDASKPFSVSAGEAVVLVTGTSFQVDSRDTATVRVAVRTGSVQVGAVLAGIQPVSLKAGEKVTLQTSIGQVVKDTLFSSNEFAWQTGVLQFDEAPILEVLSDLSAVYGLDFETDGQLGADCRFTGRFTNQPIEVVLQAIELSLGVSVQRSEDGAKWIVSGRCP